MRSVFITCRRTADLNCNLTILLAFRNIIGIYFWTVIQHSNPIHFLHLFIITQKRSFGAIQSLQKSALSIRDTKFLILLTETQEIKETQTRSVYQSNCRYNVLASQIFETIFTIVILRHCRWQHIWHEEQLHPCGKTKLLRLMFHHTLQITKSN